MHNIANAELIGVLAVATFLSTLLGGLFALRFREKLHLVLGFSAGAVISVAFFDLMPEAIHLGEKYYPHESMISFFAIGFLAYLVVDRCVFYFVHRGQIDRVVHGHGHIPRGVLGAGALSVHSFFDGVAIGLAFQVSPAVGAIVTVAVLVHDFSDGINTVNMILKNAGNQRFALKWLLVDATAPVLGLFTTMFFTLPEQALSVVLGLFAGFFLYIGASDLVPESHHAHPRISTMLMTLFGVSVLYGAIVIAGGH